MGCGSSSTSTNTAGDPRKLPLPTEDKNEDLDTNAPKEECIDGDKEFSSENNTFANSSSLQGEVILKDQTSTRDPRERANGDGVEFEDSAWSQDSMVRGNAKDDLLHAEEAPIFPAILELTKKQKAPISQPETLIRGGGRIEESPPELRSTTRGGEDPPSRKDNPLAITASPTAEDKVVVPEDGSNAPVGGGPETTLERVRREALEMHNIYRKRHGVPPLVLNDKINRYSQWWAEKMAATRKFEHSPSKKRPNYGENIYYSGSTDFKPGNVKGGTSITAFYDEIKDYDYIQPGQRKKNGGQIGHFTQVVWRNSEELGVGMATTKNGKMGYVYICCNYSPPGNWIGDFERNVPLPITDLEETVPNSSGDNNSPVEARNPHINREAPADKNANAIDAPPPPTGIETPLERVRREALWMHNVCRQRHGLAPLVSDNKINTHSQKCAATMASKRKLEPSPRNVRTNYGENLFMAGSNNFKIADVNGAYVSTFFCDGVDDYKDRFAQTWNSISTGTTRLAWKNSTKLGVGMTTAKQGKIGYVFICCHYS